MTDHRKRPQEHVRGRVAPRWLGTVWAGYFWLTRQSKNASLGLKHSARP